MSSSFVVTFNLKCPFKGDAVPIIYGNCKELGNGEPTHGIELMSEPNSIYNYQAKVRFSNEISKISTWYSYCFRPSYGSIILENAPHRYLPQFQLNEINSNNNSNYISPSVSLYDTIDEVTPIGDLILHFHVRCFTQFGQHLYIVGSCESLGNWNPSKAIQLFYEGNQDFWTGNVRIPLSNVPRVIEYKYFRSFVPKHKQKQSKDENNNFNKPQEASRENTYKDIYKDFYRSKNRNGLFFNQNRSNNRNPIIDSQPKPQKPVEPDNSNDEFDLSGIEWEPNDVQNHRIELPSIISPTVLEIADTFRWSDPLQDILTRSLFVNAANSRKIKSNSTNQRIITLNIERPGFVSVRFEAICPNISKNQDLYIVGSNKELGNWQVEKGLKMDDSNFPLFIATVTMKSDIEPPKVESTQDPKKSLETPTKSDQKSLILPKKVEVSYSFPFEYKFVIVQNEIKEKEIEVDDDSPLNSEELKKLEEMKEVEKKRQRGNFPIDEKKLIKSMKRKKKVKQKCIEKVGIWESSPNRYCPGITSHVIPEKFPSTLLINSWLVNPNGELIKRYGVSIPLFSLRSKDSCGIGQYGDIKQLVDFCNRIGCTLIQFPMPLFDTNTSILSDVLKTFSKKKSDSILSSLDLDKLETVINDADENPLKIVSAFALHPIYISLLDIIPNMPKDLLDDINQTKLEFEKKQDVDYKVVFAYKMKVLFDIYKKVIVVDKKKSDPNSKDFDFSSFYQSKTGSLFMDDKFDEFVKKESFWLYPYALFNFFREKYKNSDFRKWPKEVSKAFTNINNNNEREEKINDLRNLVNHLSSEKVTENEFELDFDFFLWIQYVCNSQFTKSFKYAVDREVAFEGVFPMNVGLNSVDCWSFPFLFRMPKEEQRNSSNEWRYQTVAVPQEPNLAITPLRPILCIDDFTSAFSYPSYDWTFIEKKQNENSECKNWWKKRISRFTDHFHALKIDPSLQLCRSWEVDSVKSVTASLGHFLPCSPINKSDLDSRNLTQIKRYTKPYARRHLIDREFGKEKAESIISIFFDSSTDSDSDVNEEDDDSDSLTFKEEYDNERKIYEAFKKLSNDKNLIEGIENERLFEYLMKVVDDVLLIEDEENEGSYFVRSNFFNEPQITLSKSSKSELHPSSSFSELSQDEKNAMKSLYDYYTYNRQNDLWLRLSKEKQKIFLSDEKRPIICIDDNEIIRTCSLSYEFRDNFDSQINSMHIMKLRVPRISHTRVNGHFLSFDDPHNFEYMSVCSPSLHNTSTLRGWWEEDEKKRDLFWHQNLLKDKSLVAPNNLDQITHEAIFKQCLWSGSQISCFLLQDLAGLVQLFRRQKPFEERITEPLEMKTKMEEDVYESCEDSCRIRYRIPYNLIELIKNDELTLKLKSLAVESHRTQYETQ